MQLHTISPKIKIKNKKRVGRGGKRGTFSGTGNKGQKSRAGHKIRPTERDLIMRIPKLRGIKNKSLQEKPVILNIRDLDLNFEPGIISIESLKEKGFVKKYNQEVKILSLGETKKSFELKGFKVSAVAKEKIETAGGKVLAKN